MSKSTKYSIRNIFKITAMVLTVNLCGLTTQYILDKKHCNTDSTSMANYAHNLIKGKVLPMVFAFSGQFVD